MGDYDLYMRYGHIKRNNKSYSLFEKLKVVEIEFVIIYDDLLIIHPPNFWMQTKMRCLIN